MLSPSIWRNTSSYHKVQRFRTLGRPPKTLDEIKLGSGNIGAAYGPALRRLGLLEANLASLLPLHKESAFRRR